MELAPRPAEIVGNSAALLTRTIARASRSLASAIGPVISGYLIMLSGFGWPLLIGGLLKSGYDLALLAMFSHVQPPEERQPVPVERRARRPRRHTPRRPP